MQDNSVLREEVLYFFKHMILLQVMKVFKIGTGERSYKTLAKAAEKMLRVCIFSRQNWLSGHCSSNGLPLLFVISSII